MQFSDTTMGDVEVYDLMDATLQLSAAEKIAQSFQIIYAFSFQWNARLGSVSSNGKSSIAIRGRI